MALIKYRQNGEWVTIPLTATEISPDIVINSSQITINNIDSSVSGDVASGDSLSVAISKIIKQIQEGIEADVDLSNYYTKTDSDARYVQVESGKGLSTNDYTTAEKEKLASLQNYTLPTATASVLGGVKIGTGIDIVDGTISVNIPEVDLSEYPTFDDLDIYVMKELGKGLSTNDFTDDYKNQLDELAEKEDYVLPIATASVLGGVKIGSGLSIEPSTGVLSADVKIGDLDLSDYATIEWVNGQISAIPKYSTSVVQQLPATDISNTTVYLVPSTDPDDQNLYTEYIYVNGAWEKLGVQKIDLSNYVTNDSLSTTLNNYVQSSDLDTAIGEAVTVSYYTTTEIDALVEAAQATLPDADTMRF